MKGKKRRRKVEASHLGVQKHINIEQEEKKLGRHESRLKDMKLSFL